jgi:phosphatidylglycerol lysyltransferase
MRHRLETPNGTMDYLLMELMLALREEGYSRFALGLAPFSGVGDRPGATLQERALNQLYEHLNRFFSYKGLRYYKAKFEPDWEERFLVYGRGPLALARVGVALTRVTEVG